MNVRIGAEPKPTPRPVASGFAPSVDEGSGAVAHFEHRAYGYQRARRG